MRDGDVYWGTERRRSQGYSYRRAFAVSVKCHVYPLGGEGGRVRTPEETGIVCVTP